MIIDILKGTLVFIAASVLIVTYAYLVQLLADGIRRIIKDNRDNKED